MTDGTATDRAQLTPAQTDARQLVEAARQLVAATQGLRQEHGFVLFDRLLAADTPSRYVQYVTGQVSGAIDRVCADAATLAMHAALYADEAGRGQLDTRADREARIRRAYPVAPSTPAALPCGYIPATGDDDADDPTDARVAAHEVAIASEPMAHELADDERHPFGAGGVQ